MKELIIKQYIDKLTKKDIYDYGIKNDIILDTNSLNIIYDYIKKDWQIILFGDITPIVNNLKSKINNDTFSKIEKLYLKTKEKYKYYL